ncbi:hypothetical protein ACTG2K_06460 [Aeromonas caviae]|nr:hypothetical protein [Aeromonas caviae]
MSTITFDNKNVVGSSGRTFFNVMAVTTATVVAISSASILPSSNVDEHVRVSDSIPASSDVGLTDIVINKQQLGSEATTHTNACEDGSMTIFAENYNAREIHSTLKISSALAFLVMIVCIGFIFFSPISLIILVPALIGSFGVVAANGIQMNQLKRNYNTHN